MRSEMARRKGRGVLEGANPKVDGSAIRRSDGKALDVRQAGRPNVDDDTRLGSPLGPAKGCHHDDRERNGRSDRRDQNGPTARAGHDPCVVVVPVPLLPGVWSGTPAAQPGHVESPAS